VGCAGVRRGCDFIGAGRAGRPLERCAWCRLRVLLLFNNEGASFQFGVWFLLKVATLVILVVVVTKSSTTEICSFVAGSLVFIPAAFRYALIEAAKAPAREESSAPDESIER